ncbi:MAG TPA: pyrroline-5-carboxylate reductase, partial [Bacillales bacterium]|nr:pyrroline-5-carboxylate reductase [Bacillales bacterium]
IGAGKMAQAMVEGILNSEKISPGHIMASAATEKTLEKLTQKYEILVTNNNPDVARFADILILAVKPDLHANIIREIKNSVNEETIIVTIAAGITLADMEIFFERKIKAIRTMPNTPSLVGEGMTVICPNERINETELKIVEDLFQSFGKTERLEEKLMDAVPAISGSSPAYIYMVIEALADGGVKQGIPRQKAYRLAAQAVLGAAKMVLETGKHPGELKDNVCTPGGATIEAVASLEKSHFRGAILSAMESCTEKIKTL